MELETILTHSEGIGKITEALSLYMIEVENASKKSKNPFFNSRYADLAEVLNTIRPVLGKHGLYLGQFPGFSGSKDGGIVSVETMLSHSSGEWFRCRTSCPVFPTISKKGNEELVSAQTIGSAITYCRRYAAAAVGVISQDDDDGNSISGRDNGSDTRPKPQPVGWTPEQDSEFSSLLAECRKYYHIMNLFDEYEEFVANASTAKKNPSVNPVKLLDRLKAEVTTKSAEAAEYEKSQIGTE